MTAATVTARGRLAAEARMVDACTITRSGGARTFSSATGYTTPAPSTLYTGACEVQVTDGLNAQTEEAGGEVATVRRLIVKVPMSVEGIATGDVVTITASLLDPDLVDREFRVTGGFGKSFATARRLQVEETTA